MYRHYGTYTGSPIGIQHKGHKFYKVYINNEPGLTMTYFTARSILSPICLKGKFLQSHLMGENLQQRAKLTD